MIYLVCIRNPHLPCWAHDNFAETREEKSTEVFVDSKILDPLLKLSYFESFEFRLRRESAQLWRRSGNLS